MSSSLQPHDCSLPGSSVYGIFQARILEWIASSFSRGSSQPRIKPASLVSPALAGRFFSSKPLAPLAVRQWWALFLSHYLKSLSTSSPTLFSPSLIWFFILTLVTCYHTSFTYFSWLSPTSPLECKPHEGGNFIFLVHCCTPNQDQSSNGYALKLLTHEWMDGFTSCTCNEMYQGQGP